ASNRIMECLHQIPERETTSRVVIPGAAYCLPPKGAAQAVPEGYDPHSTRIRPGIRTEATGKSRLVLDAAPEDQSFPTMNQAVEAFFTPKLESVLLDAARRQAAGPLKSRIRTLDRRIEKIEADQRRLKQFESLAEQGELLKANLHLVRKGTAQLEVSDWTTGKLRTIPLDPSLGPIANMEKLFRKVAKGKRGERIVQQRLIETIAEKDALEEMVYFVEQTTDMEELELMAASAIGSEPREARDWPTRHSDAREDESRLFRQFPAPSGRQVLVGKSGRGNDYLLRHKASKSDLWFHVKGIPGAHVLLPERGPEPATTTDIEFAAGLAVHYSKARGAGKGEVIIARVQDLERLKGALPGQVKVKRHKVLLCREVEPHDDIWSSKG
ncbi:MAG: DUF814 domain-containing protein, partial [Deltaproteobacteria bacterium]|nr:DUF814 domain-containing protein [Deltaproteobacteria bacterium]